MKVVVSILLAFYALPQIVAVASGYDYGIDIEVDAVAGQLQPVRHWLATRDFNDRVLPRQEIRTLEKDPDGWTLYILALDAIQWRNQSHPLSFYQLAGIHAVPWKTYDEVEQDTNDPRSGFCQHSSVLFPTWHRAYMSLFEQVLYTKVQHIASMYDDEKKPQMKEAARSFRIPYWDWAMTPEHPQEHVLPASVAQSTIQVDGPRGIQSIANPLFAYAFHPLVPNDFPDAPFNRCDITKRTNNQSLDGDSDNEEVRDRMDALLPGFQQRLYQLFSNYPNYTIFSNAAYNSGAGDERFDSIESLHDAIHGTAGLQGHMAWIWYSAFDPIFFLHHANVDRIFALWQVIYPDSWVDPYKSVYPTWTGHSGKLQNATTPLSPFYHHGGLPTTSDDVRNLTLLGYTYPELALLKPDTSSSRRANLIKTLNRLYGSSSPSQLAPAMTGLDAARGKIANIWHVFTKSSRPTKRTPGLSWDIRTSTPPPEGSVLVNGQYREWIVNIHVNKHALQSSFMITFFLGDPPQDVSTWAKAPNLVGTTSIFSGKGGGQEGNSADSAQHEEWHFQHHVTTTVTLTSALVGLVVEGRLESLEPEAVEPLLKTSLRYSVIGADSKEVGPSMVDGLAMAVVSAKVTAPRSKDELPVWGNMERHFNI